MKRISMFLFAACLATGAAFADGHGGGMGGPGPAPDAHLIVSDSGTVYTTHTVEDQSTRTATTTVTAISASGSTLFTVTLPANARGLTLSGSLLITVNEVRASDGTFTTTLTAISASTGAAAWTKTLSGAVADLTPFSGGTYAVVIVPATTSGGSATRSLVAIGPDGSTLWTVSL